MDNIKKLEEIAREYHDISANYARLEWVQFTAGYDFGVEKEYERLTNVLKNKAYYEHVLKCMESELSPIDKRKAEIMYKLFKPYHLSNELNELDAEIQKRVTELSNILNTFAYNFEDRTISSTDITQILSNDNDRDRRKNAYFSRCQINKPMIDKGFPELIRLRKQYAKLYGAESFISYKLEADELDKSTFDNWIPQLHDILPKMNEARSKYAREFLNDDIIMPWDELYIEAKLAPMLNEKVDMSDFYNIIRDFFMLFGIDISKYNITYDIFPRANKSQWAYNFPIETAKDSRILANAKNKFYEYGALLHETGHGVHSFILDPEQIILNEGVSGIISEGIANLFQGFLMKPIFYSRFFGDNEKTAGDFGRLKEYKRLNSLRALGRIFFDHSLYKNEADNLDDIYNLYWRNHKELFKEAPFGTEVPWAYTIHYTTHPIYFHNYFMGDVTCEMLASVFEDKANAQIADKPREFAEFLINEVIKPSGLYKYNDLFKRISGNDFSLKYML